MELDDILLSLSTKKISIPQAKKMLALHSIEKIEDFAKIDTGRKNRSGTPEIIFAETKQLDETKKIIQRVMKKSNLVLVSRIKKEHKQNIIEYATTKLKYKIKQGKNCSTIAIYKKPVKNDKGKIGILAAGTSDVGVAEEARIVAEAMQSQCTTSYDVGIAGMHRVMPVLKKFVKNDISVIIVVAGMEGALGTVVASLVDMPVIGVPSSVGYGYGKDGVSALASMLQSCSLGLSVVNIDNGVAAGSIAANIANKIIIKQYKVKSTKKNRG